MKYIRTYDTKEGFLADKDDNSRGFRLKPTLYKYSEAGDHIHLETDDPRKHGDSTYMEITLDSDTEFRFRICPSSTQPTSYTIDWGDGTIETKTVKPNTEGDPGFELLHNYKKGSYKIELYDVERNYILPGHSYFENGFISPASSVKRVILSKDGVAQNTQDFTGDDFCTFKNCTNLTSINIPEGAVRIGSGTFYGCSSLKSINIPEGVTSIWGRGSYGTFQDCTSLTSINIPESVTSIGNRAFSSCTSLTSINIPEGAVRIGSGTFYGCSSLKSINIPEKVTSIGSYTFQYCSSLISINIPEGVTSIGEQVFYGCSSLTSISIPEKVTSIENGTFGDCYSLTSISSLNTTAPTLDTKQVFDGLPINGTLHVKPGATGYDAWLSALPSGWTIVEDL